MDGWLGIKPGWTRLSFSFYLSEPAFDYIVQAVHLVATHGARLLPQYRFDPRSGLWQHRNAAAPPVSLRRLSYDADGRLCHPFGGHRRLPDSMLAPYLRQAEAIFAAHPLPNGDERAATVFDEFEWLRWFELPHVCLTPTRAD